MWFRRGGCCRLRRTMVGGWVFVLVLGAASLFDGRCWKRGCSGLAVALWYFVKGVGLVVRWRRSLSVEKGAIRRLVIHQKRKQCKKTVQRETGVREWGLMMDKICGGGAAGLG